MKNIMPPINTPDKSFHDGNPATGEQGTIVSAEWLNNAQGSIRNTQQELISVLTEAAIAIDENKTNQLLQAILNLITTRSPDLPTASTLQKGIVQLSSATNSASEALAATPKAVKAALDASLPLNGTAATTTKLATARKISGVDFDGTKDITLPFINTTDTNIQLAGSLGVKNLEVHGYGTSEGGQIDLFDKADKAAAFIDIDSTGNFRIVISDIGVALGINRLTGQVTTYKSTSINGELSSSGSITTTNGHIIASNGNISGSGRGDVTGDLRGGRVLSKSDVIVGEGQPGGHATIASTGNIIGSQWGGGWLSIRTARAFAVFNGVTGAVSGSMNVASVTRNAMGTYTIVFSSAMPGTYAVMVGANGGYSAHLPSVDSKSATAFRLLTPTDSGTEYPLRDLTEVQFVVFSTGT
ncbi:phage tail protein [Yersinia frederiksenii]|uniref:phage tail protein n=1 Tax=Yersinia frederiksenii TaxID=29484 RepID=UPI0025AA8497|nr:phage tail protein [Yersinia frederiksenii]MDN0117592.1 phage tail protein [Yersinia frederiksenii]